LRSPTGWWPTHRGANPDCGTPQRSWRRPCQRAADQVRPDIAGRADDQMASCPCRAQPGWPMATGHLRRRGTRRLTRADKRPDPRHRHREPHPPHSGRQPSGHRLVDIDDAAPNFRMLQCQRATQSPTTPHERVSPIAVTHRAEHCG
jgi:hypothetical protein